MSSPLPCGRPSTMSTRTTSFAKALSTIRCAAVAPTFPAPTTVIFMGFPFIFVSECVSAVVINESPLARALNFLAVRHLAVRLCGNNTDDAVGFPEPLELHHAAGEGEQGVVAPETDVRAGREFRAALAHDDRACIDGLAAEALDAEALRVAVASVPGTSAAFFMCHCECSLSDIRNFNFRVLLAMSAAQTVSLPALLLEHDH